MVEGLESQARIPFIITSVAGGKPPSCTHFARVCWSKDIRAGEEKYQGACGYRTQGSGSRRAKHAS